MRIWGNQQHILNASSNLMGICFVFVAGLKLTHNDLQTYADEFSLFAGFLFLCSCILSYFSMRHERLSRRCEYWADILFILGMLLLFVAVMLFSFGGQTVA